MLEPAIAAALLHSDRHVAITGASGWLGRASLDLLERALGPAFTSRVTCYGSSNCVIDLGRGRYVAQCALSELHTLKAKNIWVLHYAFQTKDRAEIMTESAYRSANEAIGGTVLEALDRIDADALFIASSGAATKADDPTATAAMRLYGAMKRDDEAKFAAWAEARGRHATIGRLFNVTGPYINKHDAYAIASFIRDVLAGRPIAVHATREVVRSYVAIRELLSLILALLSDSGDRVVRFDSGGEPLELGEVARIVADALGGRVERAEVTDPIADRYVGDGAAYAALLDRYAIRSIPLDQQVRETAPSIGPFVPGRPVTAGAGPADGCGYSSDTMMRC